MSWLNVEGHYYNHIKIKNGFRSSLVAKTVTVRYYVTFVIGIATVGTVGWIVAVATVGWIVAVATVAAVATVGWIVAVATVCKCLG